ncbi:MAG TPA: hypothetical protein V6D22_24195 [Candidatus Obscuribacterales bacterium]
MRLRVGIFALALALASGAALTAQAQTAAPEQPFVVGGHIGIVDGQMVAVGGQMVVDVDMPLPKTIKLKHGEVLNFVRKSPIVGSDVSIKALPPTVQVFCICHATQAATSVDPAGYHVLLAVKADTANMGETYEITHTVPGSHNQPTVQTVTVQIVK